VAGTPPGSAGKTEAIMGRRKRLTRDFELALEGEEAMLREYSDEEIQRFLEEDRLDPETLAKICRLLRMSTPGNFLRELMEE
jgi:phosphoserine phosphatase